MLIPSIDIQDQEVVQLIGGKEKALSAGDPQPLAEKFGRVGDVAVIDLDAALGRGSNREQIRALLDIAPCRVGGGIRDVETALDWLNAGAQKVILGTAAQPDLLKQLPKERTIVALDARHGQVVDQGWTRETGQQVIDRIAALKDYTDGFLLTFVEREGRMVGIDPETVQQYIDAAGDARVTIAGGVQSTEDIATLDAMGADAQVGMALYTGRISLGDSFSCVLKSDRPDGLWPTVVADESGTALGLVYSNPESIRESLETGQATYFSRTRGLWRKGETSGNRQTVKRIKVDCDRDSLCFIVQQQGSGFCHLPQPTCFGPYEGIQALEKTLWSRKAQAPAGSYTERLFQSSELLAAKLTEEAAELVAAADKNEIVHEATDVLFFVMTRLAKEGITWSEIEAELDRRHLKVTRRGGDAKPVSSKS